MKLLDSEVKMDTEYWEGKYLLLGEGVV